MCTPYPHHRPRRLYEKAARTLCRTPKFIDWDTTSAIAGLESFPALLKRHTQRKLTHMNARKALYRSRDLPYCEWIHTCTQASQKSNRPSIFYNLRKRTANPEQTYKTKILANEIEKIYDACNLSSASWNSQNFDSSLLTMQDMKDLANEFCKPYETDRSALIRASLYKKTLKNSDNIPQETEEISKYVESRRRFWNFDPLPNTFKIQYN